MSKSLTDLIKEALNEDMPNGDITTGALNLQTRAGRARVVAKEDLIVSGTQPFTAVFEHVDSNVEIQWQRKDGDAVLKGQTICTLKGPLSSILMAERVSLNFLGHLSGVATLTRCFVDQISHTGTKILDTRKTTPLWRNLERAAVLHGGGQNHRLNLSDRVLIKENHIRAAGGIQKAIQMVKQKAPSPIEVEVRNIEEVQAAVNAKADILLLDNMSLDEMREALKIIPSHIQTEASGNMTLDRVAAVAELGVTFISVGQITHSAPTADVSLLVDEGFLI